jgi:hypothetical protein
MDALSHFSLHLKQRELEKRGAGWPIESNERLIVKGLGCEACPLGAESRPPTVVGRKVGGVRNCSQSGRIKGCG